MFKTYLFIELCEPTIKLINEGFNYDEKNISRKEKHWKK